MAHQLTAIVHALLFTPSGWNRKRELIWGLPSLWIGPPSGGKTSIARQMAERCADWHYEELALASDGEGAVGKVPSPSDKDEYGQQWLTYLPPDYMKRFAPDDGEPRGLFAIDEINRGGAALLAACLKIPIERKIAGVYLGRKVRVIALMNPSHTSANGCALDDASGTRYIQIPFPAPTPEAWADYVLSGMPPMADLDAQAEEDRVEALYPEAYARAAALVTRFTQARPALFDTGDPKEEEVGKPRPCSRAWVNVIGVLCAAELHSLSERDTDMLLTGCVGPSAACEFLAWVAEQDLPNPADLLDGQATFTHDPRRPDRTMAVLDACVALVSPATAPKRKARMVAAWKQLASVMAVDKALVVVPATRLVQATDPADLTKDHVTAVTIVVTGIIKRAKGAR